MMTEYEDSVERRYYTVTGEYPNEDVTEKIISEEDGDENLLDKAIKNAADESETNHPLKVASFLWKSSELELNWKSELTEDRKLSELKPSELTSELKCGYTSGMKSG
ncbi:hypothetical protein AgCh_027813 [Apium graveolens]